MLEEFVMTDEPSDDVGESLMVRDEDFEPPEVPFSRSRPRSRSSLGAQAKAPATAATASISTTTTSRATRTSRRCRRSITKRTFTRQHPDLRDNGPRRMRPPTKPPPVPRGLGRGQQVKPIFNDDDAHSQPTTIIDIGRVRASLAKRSVGGTAFARRFGAARRRRDYLRDAEIEHANLAAGAARERCGWLAMRLGVGDRVDVADHA